MPISENRLEGWTRYMNGAINSAQTTHKRIRGNIEAQDSTLNNQNIEFDTQLQGSYANDTIVRASSDVDILVRLRDPFRANKNELSDREVDQFYAPGNYRVRNDYDYNDFRGDVYTELASAYGSSAITDGDKAILVDTDSLPLSADVVPCMEYRHYKNFTQRDGRYIEGIIFCTGSGEQIINYPNHHIENAIRKQQATSNRFKPTARMFKRARGAMIDNGIISSKSVAPSYCVECLVWNVDSTTIDQYNLQNRYCGVVQYLDDANLYDFRHEHGLLDLFGSANTDWNINDASTFITGLKQLWNTS